MLLAHQLEQLGAAAIIVLKPCDGDLVGDLFIRLEEGYRSGEVRVISREVEMREKVKKACVRQ